MSRKLITLLILYSPCVITRSSVSLILTSARCVVAVSTNLPVEVLKYFDHLVTFHLASTTPQATSVVVDSVMLNMRFYLLIYFDVDCVHLSKQNLYR